MWKDPIVEEIRSFRDAYARKFNYDLKAICEDLRKKELLDPRPKAPWPVHSKRALNVAEPRAKYGA